MSLSLCCLGFFFFRSLVIGTYTGVGSSVVLFLQLSLGALAYGLGIGILLYIWLLTVRDYHIVQVTGTIATVFTVFFTADHFLHVSGVLAVVTFGIFMAAKGSTALQRTVQSLHHQAIELLATLSVQVRKKRSIPSKVLSLRVKKSFFLALEISSSLRLRRHRRVVKYSESERQTTHIYLYLYIYRCRQSVDSV